jgi:asparagine synthase (glutamine-hydrolysing)
MCGFTGSISFDSIDQDAISKANTHIECRGPDSKIIDSKRFNRFNFSCIFNRLSILDLSEKANQPMYFDEAKTMLLFNGEIFNHQELRDDLIKSGIKFQTSHSDSETLLKGLSFYGLDFVQKLRGQFAIFFLDESRNKGYLIRDRLGQKPLYYFYNDKTLTFSSSLFSLISIQKKYEIDPEEVTNYLNYGVVSSPKTLFKNYFKVQPAEIVEIEISKNKFEIRKFNYWNKESFLKNKKFEVEKFFDLLSESIKLRTISDVPIANFLSGGIDSTIITKYLLKSGQDVNSFSVYMENQKYDESEYIKRVVNKYKIDHNAVTLSNNISQESIYDAINSIDEPYSDPSVIPSFLMSNEISKFYKVAISGDGGDELLGGYYRVNKSINKQNFYGNYFSKLYNLYPPVLGTGNIFLSKSKDLNTRYKSFLEDRNLLNLLNLKPKKSVFEEILNNCEIDSYKKILLSEYKFYLPEMMLFKVDRTSMANSLEVRSPFVDHKLIEYVLSCSSNSLATSTPKKILKDQLINDFDNSFVNRKKQGFVFDVENWVFNNINLIKDVVQQGSVIYDLNKNIINFLSLYRSRINGQRIWKQFDLENYLKQVQKL